jgi:hypothetical protein
MLEESTMDNEIQLITDGDGLAVIGSPTAVELFLAREGLASKDLGLPRLGAVFKAGAEIAQAGSEMANLAGRWVELTKESAHLVEKHGLRKHGKSGLRPGQRSHLVEGAGGVGDHRADAVVRPAPAGRARGEAGAHDEDR